MAHSQVLSPSTPQNSPLPKGATSSGAALSNDWSMCEGTEASSCCLVQDNCEGPPQLQSSLSDQLRPLLWLRLLWPSPTSLTLSQVLFPRTLLTKSPPWKSLLSLFPREFYLQQLKLLSLGRINYLINDAGTIDYPCGKKKESWSYLTPCIKFISDRFQTEK